MKHDQNELDYFVAEAAEQIARDILPTLKYLRQEALDTAYNQGALDEQREVKLAYVPLKKLEHELHNRGRVIADSADPLRETSAQFLIRELEHRGYKVVKSLI
jgi:hypothetical protein